MLDGISEILFRGIQFSLEPDLIMEEINDAIECRNEGGSYRCDSDDFIRTESMLEAEGENIGEEEVAVIDSSGKVRDLFKEMGAHQNELGENERVYLNVYLFKFKVEELKFKLFKGFHIDLP